MATQRPPALKHGLTSRTVHEDWSEDVSNLAGALLGASPREPQLIETAREAAEAILYLRRVQHCRLLLLENSILPRCTPGETERALALRLSGAVKRSDPLECQSLRNELCVAHERDWVVDVPTAATFILGDELANYTKDLRRLAEYERRAHSARTKALRRLEFERVEGERRRVKAANVGSTSA